MNKDIDSYVVGKINELIVLKLNTTSKFLELASDISEPTRQAEDKVGTVKMFSVSKILK